MTYDIIAAAAKDAAELEKLEKRCFSEPWSEKSLAEEILHPDAIVLTAQSCGGMLGYIAMRDISGEAELMRVAADPDCRRLGIGKALLETALLICEKRGVTAVHLEVEDGNAPAMALYEKTGFTVDGRREKYYGDKAAILMTKVI